MVCWIVCVLTLLQVVHGGSENEDVFDEELLVKQLSTGSVYSIFQFVTKTNINIFEEVISPHYNLFPKSFGEIVSKFGIAELHFSMTQGRWRYNQWGYPLMSAPTGIELWVWFLPKLDVERVDKNWAGLVHALSGQFCSSINFVTKAETASPKYTFKPSGLWPHKNNVNQTHLKYAALSRETVCTENLTPWKKLLPCGAGVGLASLLNAVKLYDSSYHSLAVHLQSNCKGNKECDSPVLELRQTVSSVFDPYHRVLQGVLNLHNMFGTVVKSKCPIARSSNIVLHGSNVNLNSLSPPPSSRKQIEIAGKNFELDVYDLLNKDLVFPFDLQVPVQLIRDKTSPAYVLVHKHTTGFGEEYGGSTCIVENNHPRNNITLAYLDIVPYFLRLYVHTLRLEVNGIQVKPEHLQFSPAYHRERPARLEFIMTLPAQSKARISIEFEKVFQDWIHHPPDAHHGFYVGSSVISGYLPVDGMSVVYSPLSDSGQQMREEHASSYHRIYSEPLLIRVPLPDFSMPYNVICLTCTVIAIAFGSLYNLTTRTFQVEAVKEKRPSLKERIIGLFKKKVNTETEDQVERESGESKISENEDKGEGETKEKSE